MKPNAPNLYMLEAGVRRTIVQFYVKILNDLSVCTAQKQFMQVVYAEFITIVFELTGHLSVL